MKYFRQRTLAEQVIVSVPTDWGTNDTAVEEHLTRELGFIMPELEAGETPFLKLQGLNNFLLAFTEIAGKNLGEETLEILTVFVSETCMAIVGFDDGGLLGQAMLETLQIHEGAV